MRVVQAAKICLLLLLISFTVCAKGVCMDLFNICTNCVLSKGTGDGLKKKK